MNKIVTISRQYASGGREVAEKLAMKYGIPFYDRELRRVVLQKLHLIILR